MNEEFSPICHSDNYSDTTTSSFKSNFTDSYYTTARMVEESKVEKKKKKSKRPRRKFQEVERLYFCNYHNCNKGYSSLSHLNDHVSIQNHGPRRQPEEFKELRRLLKLKNQQQEQQQKTSTTSLSQLPLNYPFVPLHYFVPVNNTGELEVMLNDTDELMKLFR